MNCLPGPYRVTELATTCVTMVTEAALRLRGATSEPCAVDPGHAAEAFRSERHTRVTGEPPSKLWSPLSGDYRAADGWVRLHANYPHHAAAIRDTLGEDPATEVARRTAVEVEALVLAAGGAAAAMRTREEWLTDGPGSAIREEPLVAIEKIGEAPPRSLPSLSASPGSLVPDSIRLAGTRAGHTAAGRASSDALAGWGGPALDTVRPAGTRSEDAAAGSAGRFGPGDVPPDATLTGRSGPHPGGIPLAGVRVLDLTHVIAGPVCGRVLAAHGADVLHVTPPGRPVLLDLLRDTDFGKRQCRVGLGDELRALAAQADVFVQSYRPGSLASKGFGPADLAALRPGIVVVSLSAYGHTGPWRERRGFDSLVQMACGIAAHAGTDRPRPLPAQALDHGTGWLAAYGVLTALRRRATEGGSWHVRLSLARTAEWLHDLGRQTGDVSTVDPTSWLTETESDFGNLTHIRVPCAPVDLAGPRKPGRDPASWW